LSSIKILTLFLDICLFIFVVVFCIRHFPMKFKLNKINKNITQRDIINDIQHIAQKLSSDTVHSTQYRKIGKYAANTVLRHFGSWNNALTASGLRVTVHNGLTKLEMFQNLKRVWLKLGRQPMRKEMTPEVSEFSWRAYRHAFGSFRRALEEFVEFANKRRVYKHKTPFIDIIQARAKNRTQRRVGYGLRYKVLERDGYKCVKCGSSPAYGNGTRLHIDHIKPYSKGGETVLSNLQTLCEECNLGKGNKSN
jgi:hypothetical protein